MQQPAASVSSSDSSSFAGLLAGLTSPGRDRREPWNDDDLADDVATLTYERVLRAHGRYQAADSDDEHLIKMAPEAAGANDRAAAILAHLEDPGTIDSAAEPLKDESSQLSSGGFHPGADRKCSSITIRMSKGDCEQLRKRAAEAGLTVSAYLRSCTIEAETLRSQVKEALARLQANSEPGVLERAPTQRPLRQTGLRQFLARLRTRQHVVEV